MEYNMPFKDPAKAKSYRNKYYKRYYAEKKEYYRNKNYQHNYGINLEEYDRMYDEQNGKCAICDEHKPRLCVDHNHKTGKVRKLLCRYCNIQLSLVEGTHSLVVKMKEYLNINS